MKKNRTIFIFVILFGMIFTIFQYNPILEEESDSPSEISIKVNKTINDSGDDDTSDDDSNENYDDQLSDSFNHHYFDKLSSSCDFYIKSKKYNFPDYRVNTPPPKS